MAKRRVRLNDDNDPLSLTDQVLRGYEKASTGGNEEDNKSKSQEVNTPTTQQVDKSELRKSTFQLNKAVSERLDTFHLELQLKLGKAAAPYKEVIVEEAISRLLEEAKENKADVIRRLRDRQEKREGGGTKNTRKNG
jgi:hypothetical protein